VSGQAAARRRRVKCQQTLVYDEIHADILIAIKREKNIQAWKREWEKRLIEECNPHWEDLYDDIIGKI
jgi:putative endonuclease